MAAAVEPAPHPAKNEVQKTEEPSGLLGPRAFKWANNGK